MTSYEINAAQWADHASADRWMALPGAEPVQIDSDAKWIFPDGAVLAKTVSIEMSQGDSNSVRRLETQVLHREEGAWRPYTYAWNDEQSDAELVDAAGFTRTLQIRDAQSPSGLREQSYRFASRGECQMCHNPWVEMKTTSIGIQSASPLAVSSMQWNTSLPEDPAQNQMTALHGHGWLAGSVAESPSSTGRFANPYDTTAVLEERVRAYLHVNCSHCHQPHAGGSATIDLLHDVKLADAKLIDAKPGQGAFGISAARIVSPGDPLGSVLHYRMATIGSGRMPRIGSEEVDEQAVGMIREWIAQLPASSPPATPVPATNPQIFPRLIAGSKVERDAIVKQLTSSTRGALELMIWLQQPDLNADVRQEIVALTVENPQAEIRGLFERFVPASQRAKRLGTAVNAAELLAMEADVERGRQLFVRDGSTSCKSCHRVNGTGETLGPDLSQIGKKYSPAEMLTHLLEPSRFIDAKYVPYVLETTGGLVHSGLLLEKTDTEIVLKNAQNKEVRVPAGDVESLVSQQKSLMPELLLREMTPQQAADLLAFLTSLRQ